MKWSLPSPPSQIVDAVPPDIHLYLTSHGWSQWSAYNGYYYTTPNISGYFTWEQAVAYDLVKPFLI